MKNLLGLAAALGGAAVAGTWTVSAADAGVLLAADLRSHQVVTLDLKGVIPIRPFTAGATMDFLSGMTLGPDGHLYVLDGSIHSISGTNRVLRFNGRTGVFKDVFIQMGPEGWDGDLTFGPDGHLYVICSWERVRKYDARTGRLLGDVLSLIGPPGIWLYSIAAGPDGRLYVTGGASRGFIARCWYDGSELELFDSGGDSNGPRQLVWDRGGDFYCADLNDGVVRKYDGETGASLGVFADPPGNGHVGLAFGGDDQLYVSGVWNNSIFRADRTTGAILGILAATVQASELLAVPPPEIVAQPKHYTAREGGNAIFTLAVRSVALSSYQWSLDGAPIVGATNASLRLAGVTTSQAGNYSVAVSNIGGVITSEVARLTVLQPPRLQVSLLPDSHTLGLTLIGDDRGIYAIESCTNLTEWIWVDTWWAGHSPVEVQMWTWTAPFVTVPVPQSFYRTRLLP